MVKFLGLTQSGTTYTENGVTVTTGLDHIEELGVNAVQLLPIFDFGYVDEVQAFLNPNYSNIFNWGYMPYHYNVLKVHTQVILLMDMLECMGQTSGSSTS